MTLPLIREELRPEADGYTLYLFLDPQKTEFACERLMEGERNTHHMDVQQYAQQKYPGLKIKMAKLMVGSLLISAIPVTEAAAAPQKQAKPVVEYAWHQVKEGESAWSISIDYGIPMHELLQANGLPEEAVLAVGQQIKVPVHHIPVKPTVSPQHGEYLDWWSEAQYVFPIGKIAKVTDLATGRIFRIKRTIGANHADCEPLTAADAAVMKEVWGGQYSWKERAVLIEVDGRKLAASMASMPHGVEYIKDNNFTGHFDVHFPNSTRHKDGKVSRAHQEQIRLAAGLATRL